MATHFKSLSSPTTLFAIFTIFLLCSSSTSASKPKTTPSKPFKKIFAFGDSFTDTGNTRSQSGPNGFGHVSDPPYGITFFHRPTNRYSDGRLVIDFVAQSLGLPFLPPYRSVRGKAPYGVNFAVGGSTAINHQFFVKNNLTLNITPQSIQTQLLWFEKYLANLGCKVTDSSCKVAEFDETLFWVGEIGVNDYAYTLGSSVLPDTIQKLAISSFSGFLTSLLKKGAKYVVVQGIPMAGCLPLSMALAPEGDRDNIGCVKSINDEISSHNQALLQVIQNLRTQFPKAVISYADYWNAYRTVMQNPRQYGITEPFKACCGNGEPYNFDVFQTCGTPAATVCSNPSQYINWDGVHLTEGMYNVVSNMFLKGNLVQPPFSSLLDKKLRQG
ncbi:hypothetical protein UlMin_007789 [Ulmus minor]